MTAVGAPDFLPNVRPQADYDVLYDQPTIDLHTVGTVSVQALAGIYQSIYVWYVDNISALVTVEVKNHTLGGVVTGPIVTSYPGFVGPLAWVPFFNRANDQLDVAFTAAATTGTGRLQILGLRVPVPPNIRSDGRPFPSGEQTASAEVAVTTTLIPSPAGNNRILVAECEVIAAYDTAAAGSAILRGSQYGNPLDLAYSQGISGSQPVSRYSAPGGIMLDPGTRIQIIVAGGVVGSAWGRVTYDVCI